MKNNLKNIAGVTLVELMVGVAVTALILRWNMNAVANTTAR